VTARRGWAWPLVPVYAGALALKDGLRQIGILRTRSLQWPVVSVGSLSAGGAGKTPVVIALAQLLHQRGWMVDVLSRGYGREGRTVERVNADAKDAAQRFGDEPVLIARRTSVPLWVGANRFAAGAAAERAVGLGADSSDPLRNDKVRRVHLLDDGFQHRRLARAPDVVLVTAEDLDDVLLPAGNRREPLTALRRADVVVLREEERERVEPQVRGSMRADAAIWTVSRTLGLQENPAAPNRDRRFISFCAIARPDNFVEMLRREGLRVVDSVTFSDHHRYMASDMDRLIEVLHGTGGDAFVTTEKDAVKITADLRARLEAAALLLVARLEAAFLDPDAVVRELEARIS
jgi:tetraacyldisaccharide 4'-kinase